MATEYKENMMMKIFAFICLLVSGALAGASVQTTANQDKPPRLYIKTYTEAASGKYQGFINELYLDAPIYYNSIYSRTIGESINYNDNSASSASCQQNTQWTEDDSDPYDPPYTHTLLIYTENVNTSISNVPGTGPDSVPITETYTMSSLYNFTWDIGQTNYPGEQGTNTTTGFGMTVISEHCDMSVPFIDYSSHGYEVQQYCTDICSYQETYRRTAQVQWKLQTGGKATSKLRNLFGLQGWAGTWIPIRGNWGNADFYFTSFENADSDHLPGAEILPQNISIAACGNLTPTESCTKFCPTMPTWT
jgi:hypothetical protein